MLYPAELRAPDLSARGYQGPGRGEAAPARSHDARSARARRVVELHRDLRLGARRARGDARRSAGPAGRSGSRLESGGTTDGP